MKTISTYPINIFLFLCFCLLNVTTSFSQVFIPDGNYNVVEYLNAQTKIVDANASSSCQVERVFAVTKGNEIEQYLLLGINNGNGGSAIFRYYINTDGNTSTGITSETYKGTVYPIGGAEIILELNASKNALTITKYTSSGNVDPTSSSTDVTSAIGSYVPGDNSFIEIKIPLSIFDICNSTNNGVITLAKYLSFSGGSISSAPCALENINFTIGLNGIVTPNKEYCAGQDTKTTLSLTGQLGNVVRWESSTDNLFTLPTTINNTTTTYDTPANLTVTTYFRAVISSTLCLNITLNSQPAKITVNPGPTIIITDPAAVCTPLTANLTVAAVTTGSTIGLTYTYWTNAGATTPYATPATATAGTYYIKGTTNAGCFNIKPVTVIVNPKPSVTNAATATICSGTDPNITLTATAPSSFTWTIGTITGNITGATAGSGATINQTLTNPSNATAGTVEYIVTPTSTTGTCIGAAFTITVTVNPKPSVTNAAIATICSGTGPNITLTATAPSSFTWTIGTITGSITGATAGSGATINQTLTNPSNATAGTVEYIVTPTSTTGTCIGAAFTITVTVNPKPSVTNAATATICSGTDPNITLTATAPSSFTWTIGTITGNITGATAGSGAIINQTLTNPSNATAGTVEYIVTPTSTTGTCIGAAFTITVTVNPKPSVTNAATATICSGTDPNITLTATAPSSFTWTIGTITGNITGATDGTGATINQTLTNPSNATAGTVEYIVTPTSTTGTCIGAAFTITVTVNPKPSVTNAAIATICSGTGPNITLTATAPSSFTWTIGTITGNITGATAGSGAIINQTLTNPSNATAGTVEYIVTPTSTTGTCIGAAFTITVTVNPKPLVTNAATATICSGTGPNITLTATAPSSFTWTIGTITGSITGTTAGSGATINQTLTNPSNATAGTVEYIVTPTSTTGTCIGAAFTITVTVNPKPSVTNAATATICSGTDPNITLTATAPSSFTWTIGTITGNITGATAGSGAIINQTLTNPSNATAGTVEYIVTPTSTTGTCIGAAFTITVTVNPKPSVTNAATATICSGTDPNITLTATAPSSFTWTIGTITGNITGATAGSGATINQTLTNPSNATAGTVEYIVTPTSTTGTCIGAAFTITVTVNPKPSVTNAAIATICSGTGPNITLTATAPSSFTWTIGTITGSITGATAGSGATINQTLTNPSNATAGTVEYIVTPTSTTGTCIGAAFTITVTVNPKPSVTNAATATICSGTDPNITLTATAPSSFTWTIGTITGNITGATDGTGAIINQTLTNPSNATAGTVEYIVTPTSTTGTCIGAAFTITVTVNPKPSVTNAAIATICSGTGPNITLTATAPSSFTWTIGTITGSITGATAGSGATINQTLTNPSNATAGTVEYIVTPTSTTGTCIGAAFTITVTVNPKPSVTNAATATICSGTDPNITLTATAPSSFTWTIGTITGNITGATAGSGAIINQTLTNPSNATAGTVEYIVTPTSTTGTCIGAAFTITVTVNPKPSVTNAATATICSGTDPNITLTATAPSSFTWTIGTITGNITGATAGSGATINQTLTNPSNATAGTVEYIVTPTSTTGTCIGAAFTITVTVNPKPSVTNAATATICSGTGPNITLTATTPSNFTWTVGAISGNITGATDGTGAIINQTLTNPSNATAGTVEYIVTPTSTTGTCTGAAFTITVTVNSKPSVTNAATATICSGTGPNITLTATAPSNFTWTIGTITGSITGATAGSGATINQTLTNPSNATAGTVEYIVTPTSTTGTCIGAAFTITVTVNPKPSVTNAATATICSGTDPNITLTATAPSSFTWTIGTITGIITGATAGSGTTINQTLTNPSNATAGTVEYIVTPTSTTGTCTGATFTITVTVNPKPVLTSSLTPAAICSATTYAYNSLSSTASSTFSWIRNAVSGISNERGSGTNGTISEVLVNTTSSPIVVTYIVNIAANSCTTSQNVTVTVNPLPIITTTATATSVCFNESAQITPLTYNVVSGTPIKYNIVWNAAPANNFIAVTNEILPNSPISIAVPAGTPAGTYTGTITVENANGCVSNGTTFTITVNKCLISIVKESKLNNTGSCTSVGDTITYTFTVTNPGTTPITNITITDPLLNVPNPIVQILLASGDTNGDMSLDVNETWIYTATYAITQNDIDTGNVTNQATVDALVLGGDPVTGSSGTITRLCQNPKIAIVKTNDIVVGEDGCANLVVGSIVTYTFNVTNPGNVSLNNVIVTDPHVGLSAIALLSGGDANTNNILEVNETWTYTATYTVTQADIDAGKITNQASVDGFAPDETKVSDLSGDGSTTNEENVIPICSTPKIAIVKTNDIVVGEDGCANLVVGSIVTYTFNVTNPGNVSLNNVMVTDPHVGLSAIALLSGGDVNTNNILEVTETWTYTATYTVTQTDIDAGKITNQASVDGFAPDETKVSDLSGDGSTTNEENVIPICSTPKIAIVKTNDIVVGEDGCANLVVGSIVTYTFNVTNPGNVSLQNVMVTDPHVGLSAIALLSGGDANTNNILEVTETWTYTATYTVTQADIDAGKITNQASVDGFAPDETKVSDLSGDGSTTNEENVIPICSTPKIAIVKTNDIVVGEDGCANLVVGSIVTYTFNVTNPGNVSLQNVMVTDPHVGLSAIALLSGGDANTNNILEVTETWTYTATYSVTQADIDAGKITNQASVDGFAPDETKVSDLSGDGSTTNEENVIPICSTPKIAIVKTNDIVVGEDGCANLVVGSIVTYTFNVTNPGNVSLQNVIVTDPHVGLSAIALLSGGDANTNNILEVTETWTYTATYTVTQADIDAGKITNQASVDGFAPDETKVSDLSGDGSTTNEENVIPICSTPKIAIVKTNDIVVGEDGCANLVVGSIVTYTFNVTNPGNVSLQNVIVTDPHVGLSAIALLSGGDANTNNILEVTETWTYTATYTVTQADIDAGKITNQASVDGFAPDETKVSDLSGDGSTTNEENVIPICSTPKIAIVKTNDIVVGEDGCANLVVGSIVTYTFNVTNPGNVSLQNVIVTDPHVGLSAIALLSGGDANTNNILEVTETWTYTATYTVTQADIDAGKITNQASVDGFAPDETKVSDLSGDGSTTNEENVIPICSTPKIAIVKTNDIVVGEDGCANLVVGSIVTYTFNVTNPGNVSLQNVIVTDPHVGLSAIALLSGGDANTNNILEVTETWTYTATYTVTQADIDAGKITNQASVDGFAPDETKVSDLSGDGSTTNEENVIPICSTPKIAIVKTNDIVVGEDGCVTLALGDIITYTFTVTNPGNVSLHNVAIQDLHPGLSSIAFISGGDANSNNMLEVTETWIYRATYAVNQADIDAGTITNQASVDGFAPDETKVSDLSGSSETNNDADVLVICTAPSITITKDGMFNDSTSPKGIINPGDTITYTFVIKNTGNVTLTNVTITDPLPGIVLTGGPLTSLAAGASNSTTFIGTYTITQADINAGVVYNLATVSATQPSGTVVTATSTDPTLCAICPPKPDCTGPDCANYTVTPLPNLKVTKTATVTSRGAIDEVYSFVGDVINYNIRVENTGYITILNIVVKDPLTGLNNTIATLAPGEYRDFSEIHTVTIADLKADSVLNIATADGLTPTGSPIHAEDSLTIEKASVLGCESILVHNAFSPNGDGINEMFVIDGLEDTICYPENAVEIYNRWGVLVFETQNYNNQTNAFDGYSSGRTTVSSSTGLPTGTYFYIINYTSVDLNGAIRANQKDGYLYLTR